MEGVRSPHAMVGGLRYFGRMIDKIRAHARGELSADYTPNLGIGFDGSCCKFLALEYQAVVARVKAAAATDEELLEWCFQHGRRPTENDIEVWSEWMRKRGWEDEITDTLIRRKKQSGFEDRDDLQTMFQYIDADEGRS